MCNNGIMAFKIEFKTTCKPEINKITKTHTFDKKKLLIHLTRHTCGQKNRCEINIYVYRLTTETITYKM